VSPSRSRTRTCRNQESWSSHKCPGSGAEAAAWLSASALAPDEIDTIDQLFLLRHHGDWLHLPQIPEIAAALPAAERTGKWHLMRADSAMAAFNCVRARLNHEPGHASDCLCAAQRIAKGTWQKMRHRLAELRPGLAPSLPPDVRMPSWRNPPRTVRVGTVAK